MNLSTQLRIILLLVGAAIWLAIYLFGKRKAAAQALHAAPPAADTPQVRETPGFTPAEDLDEDAFETPAYMRRQSQREPRQDYEPRIADVSDYTDLEEVRDDGRQDNRQWVDDELDRPQVHAVFDAADDLDSDADRQQESIYAGSRFDEPLYVEPAFDSAINEPAAVAFSGRREPTLRLDEFEVEDNTVANDLEPEPAVQDESVRTIEIEPPTLPSIPVVEHPVAAVPQGYTRRSEPVANPGLTAAPTLSDVVPAERVAARTSPASSPDATVPAPAPGASKATGNAARRKIIALRIPMPERVPGGQLLSLLQGERLQHGKFSIFHRMQDAGTVFSVASMVEPGTFDPQVMSEQQFPGVTLFMLLPGPVDGLVAYDQMLSCAQRIAHATGGVLQDERGSKLTPQTMEKLRDEVLDFQHLIGGMAPAT